MDDIKKILITINSNPSDTLISDNIHRRALHEQLVGLVNDANSKLNKFFDFQINGSTGEIRSDTNLLLGATFSLPGAGQNAYAIDPSAEGNVRNPGNPRNSGDNKTPPPGDPNTTEKLKHLIGRLESGNNYNKVVGGSIDPNLTTRTVEENKDIYGNKALGKYQIQYPTFKDNMGDTNVVFSPELQEKTYEKLLITRGKLNDFKAGKISIERFALLLSTVWAALPKDDSNYSYYAGKSGNRALVNWPTFLKTIRNSYPGYG